MKTLSSLYGRAFARGKTLVVSILVAGPVTAEPVVVAALGDSLTHGYGLEQGAGFVPQLEAWLRARGLDVVVQNAGVSGDTTQGGLARVDWTLVPEVDAMVVALGGNDVLRGIDPAVSKANLAGILQAGQKADVAMLLIGMTAPLNFGEDYKAAFDGMYRELAAAYDVPLGPEFFTGLRDVPLEARGQVMQADGIHPNAEGVLRVVEALGPSVAALVAQTEASK